MQTQTVNDIDVHCSSGNVFADLGLPDAETLLVKTRLIIEIRRAIKRLGLSQSEAARRMRITQPRLSAMITGKFDGFSEKKLMACLAALGYVIEIRARPSKGTHGLVTFTLQSAE